MKHATNSSTRGDTRSTFDTRSKANRFGWVTLVRPSRLSARVFRQPWPVQVSIRIVTL
jgi:hypothetical protein